MKSSAKNIQIVSYDDLFKNDTKRLTKSYQGTAVIEQVS